MRSSLKTCARLTRTVALPKSPPQRLCIHHRFPRTYSTLAFRNLEDEEMGKEKVQFQLKTPKGTKDCISLSFYIVNSSLTMHRGGQGHGDPRPDILHPDQCLQAPRSSNDRYVRRSYLRYGARLPRTDTGAVPSLSSAKSSLANMAKTANSSTTWPTKAASYALYATISQCRSPAG